MDATQPPKGSYIHTIDVEFHFLIGIQAKTSQITPSMRYMYVHIFTGIGQVQGLIQKHERSCSSLCVVVATISYNILFYRSTSPQLAMCSQWI